MDGGECAKATFPNPNDLMNFQVIISPDDGYWKGYKYTFNFTVPDMYPHDPPKVKCINKVCYCLFIESTYNYKNPYKLDISSKY